MVKWISYNRFLVLTLSLAVVFWGYAASCTPATPDPQQPSRLVNAAELQLSFDTWQLEQQITAKRYERAGEDLQQQVESNKKIEQLIINLASANVADLPGLVTLLLGGGGLGAIADNIRKRGLIAGLKRNNS